MEIFVFVLLVIFILMSLVAMGRGIEAPYRPLNGTCPNHPGVTRCVCRGNL